MFLKRNNSHYVKFHFIKMFINNKKVIMILLILIEVKYKQIDNSAEIKEHKVYIQ